MIIYTSGTTGSPKGVMLTFENLIANIEAVSEKVPIITKNETILMLLPCHHIFPLMGTIVIPLYAGSTIAMSPSMASEDIINTLKEHKVSIMIGVPRLYYAIRKGIMDKVKASKLAMVLFKLAKLAGSKSFSKTIFKTAHNKFGGHIKYLVSGGAAIDKEAVHDFKILGFEVLEGYGMSEAAPMITFTRPSKVRLGSAGQAVPGIEINIVENEITARGKNIMAGYYNKPDDTAEVIKNGWLYTGDLGHLDKEGYLFITGRKKDIIILSNGKNINPEEIEMKLEKLSPAVKEVGVFAMDDSLHAVILPDFTKIKNDTPGDFQDFFKWNVIDPYNNQVSPYKKIHGFTLVNEELPKTRLGKIKHFQLEKFAVHMKKRKSEENIKLFEEYELIKKFIEEQFEKDVHPTDHIEMDLAIDSLGLVSLSVFVHASFGISIKENDFAKYESVIKLAEYIKENRTKLTVENIQWSDILKSPFSFSLSNPKKQAVF
ncbi:MAG: AMP-binding protein [Bacteroidales bacterium]|nr:AMP-binding protein [Bacteroidales bacterium]